MIDIPKLRDTAKKIRGVSWVTSKPCQFHEFMELLDKAEKWDKIKAGPSEEAETISPKQLMASWELMGMGDELEAFKKFVKIYDQWDDCMTEFNGDPRCCGEELYDAMLEARETLKQAFQSN